MRILHLTTFVQGGAGLVLVRLAAAQQAVGHSVHVVTSLTGVPGYGNYAGHLSALEAAGVTVHAVDSLFVRQPDANRAVARFIDRSLGGIRAYDIVHAHAAVPTRIALEARRAARASRPAVVQTMHGWGVQKSHEQQTHDVATMRAADRVVVPSEHSRRLLERLGVPARRLTVVGYGVEPWEPPAVDDPLVREIRQWRQRGGEVLCTVGTVGLRKNQHMLVDALSRSVDLDALLCVVVGEGETDALVEQARTHRVLDAMRIVGYRSDARRVAAAADYFILPSLSEGQPLAVLEAWADGVPVLCSRTPELVELTHGGQGALLFDPTDADDIGRAVLSIRRAPPSSRQRLVERARAIYRECFTLETMLAGYQSQYASLLGEERQAA